MDTRARPAAGLCGTALAAAGLVAVLYALILWPVLVGREVLYTRDILPFLLPFKHEAARALTALEWPILSTSLMGGMPLWAHPSAEIADPSTVLFVLFPVHVAFALSVLGHAAAAAAGAAALARALGSRPAWAVLCAVFYAGCGPVMSVWPVKAVSSVALPFMALAGVAWSRRWAWAPLCAALSTGYVLLHPDPPPVAGGALIAAVLSLSRRGRSSVRATWGLAVSGALGLLVAGAFLWPAAHVMSDSPRAALSEWSAASSLGWRWIELMAPGALGVAGATGAWLGVLRRISGDGLFIGSLYAGGLMLAGVVGMRFPRRADRLLAVLGAFFVILAHGDLLPGAGRVWSLVHARFPEKMLLPAYLCVAVLAARSLSRQSGRGLLLGGVALVVLAAAADPLGSLVTERFAAKTPAQVVADRELFSLHLVLGASTGALTLLALGGLRLRRPLWAAPCAIAGACLECAVGSMTALPTMPAALAVSSVAARLAPGTRVACCDARILAKNPPTATAPQLPPYAAAAENARRLVPAYGVLSGLRYPIAPDVGGFEGTRMRALIVSALPALSTQGARHVLAAWGVDALLMRETADPRAVAIRDPVQGPLFITGLMAPRAEVSASTGWVTRADVGNVVGEVAAGESRPVLEGTPEDDVIEAGEVALHVTHSDATGVELEVDTPADAVVVVQRAFREGWSVAVDDAPATLSRAAALHLAVRVPQGRHRVVFGYAMPGGQGGAWLTVSGLVLAVAWTRRRLTRAARRPKDAHA